jgi:hypothetical protein
VARPTANLGEHLHRSLNLDFLVGKRRNRCMISSPLLIEPSHPLRDQAASRWFRAGPTVTPLRVF